MPVERVIDDAGDGMTLIRYNGDRFGASDFREDMLEDSKNVALRDDDVMICSYSKSGCHWICEMVRILQDGRTDLDLEEKEKYMIEYSTHQHLASLPSPRVLNNHFPLDLQPDDLLRKKVKVVFIYRNPKDVAVSFYHHHKKFEDYDYKGTFDNYLKRFVQGKVDNGNIFEYLQGWEAAILNIPELPVFVGSYENLQQFTLHELRRLSNFLGHAYNDQFLQEVANVTSFHSMKKVKGPASVQGPDGSPIMYRKGVVGDWKNVFTKEQNSWFDDVISSSMKNSKFRFRYSLDDPPTLESDIELSTTKVTQPYKPCTGNES